MKKVKGPSNLPTPMSATDRMRWLGERQLDKALEAMEDRQPSTHPCECGKVNCWVGSKAHGKPLRPFPQLNIAPKRRSNGLVLLRALAAMSSARW
jgi:hypothetical protein